jgi:hypothetical protein
MLRITQLSKSFQAPSGNIIALRDLELFVEKETFFVLLGQADAANRLYCVASQGRVQASA